MVSALCFGPELSRPVYSRALAAEVLLSRAHSVVLTLGGSIFLLGPIDYRLPLAGLVWGTEQWKFRILLLRFTQLVCPNVPECLNLLRRPGLQTRRPSLKGSLCN